MLTKPDVVWQGNMREQPREQDMYLTKERQFTGPRKETMEMRTIWVMGRCSEILRWTRYQLQVSTRH